MFSSMTCNSRSGVHAMASFARHLLCNDRADDDLPYSNVPEICLLLVKAAFVLQDAFLADKC